MEKNAHEHTHLHTHTHTHTCIHADPAVFEALYACIYTHNIYVHIHTYSEKIHMNTHTHLHTNPHAYIHADPAVFEALVESMRSRKSVEECISIIEQAAVTQKPV